MPVDLTATRALLASVAGFTEGPWRVGKPNGGFHIIRTHETQSICGFPANKSYNEANAEFIAAAPDLHRELTEAVGEIERLRAHTARMVAQINALADACEAAMSSEDGPLVVCDALPGRRWSECNTALRRLAAGEVDDG